MLTCARTPPPLMAGDGWGSHRFTGFRVTAGQHVGAGPAVARSIAREQLRRAVFQPEFAVVRRFKLQRLAIMPGGLRPLPTRHRSPGPLEMGGRITRPPPAASSPVPDPWR